MLGPNPQQAKEYTVPPRLSVTVTPPGCVTAPPVLQATTEKVANASSPLMAEPTRDLVTVNLGGPISVVPFGMVAAWEKNSAPPQLLVL